MAKLGLAALLTAWAGAVGAEVAYSLQRATILYPDNATIVDSGYSEYSVNGTLVLHGDGTYTQSATVCNAQTCATAGSSGALIENRAGLTYRVRDSASGAYYNFTVLQREPLILSGNSNGIAEIHRWVPVTAAPLPTLKLASAPGRSSVVLGVLPPDTVVHHLIGYLAGVSAEP
jgi:hypothetical protein